MNGIHQFTNQVNTQSTDGTLLNRKRQVGFRGIQRIIRDAIILDSQDESAIEGIEGHRQPIGMAMVHEVLNVLGERVISGERHLGRNIRRRRKSLPLLRDQLGRVMGRRECEFGLHAHEKRSELNRSGLFDHAIPKPGQLKNLINLGGSP